MSKLLIIEDDQTIRNTLSKRLNRLGHQIIEATTGDEGIEKATNEVPDLILLDLIMPNKSGFEVLEELRITKQLTMPILVITNLDQKDDIETAKNLGANDYILKSNISLQKLAAKVNSFIHS